MIAAHSNPPAAGTSSIIRDISVSGSREPLPASSKPKSSAAADSGPAALILVGRDESGKPHASWFAADDADLATKAAAIMSMAAMEVSSDPARQLAKRLPAGRVFASGRAFVPFVKASLFEELVALLSPEAQALARQPAPASPKRAPSAVSSSTSKAAASEVSKEGSSTTSSQPIDWSAIVKGSLVLASIGSGEPWYEAVVVEEKPTGLLVLRWRDYPDEPTELRRREQVALFHPSYKPS